MAPLPLWVKPKFPEALYDWNIRLKRGHLTCKVLIVSSLAARDRLADFLSMSRVARQYKASCWLPRGDPKFFAVIVYTIRRVERYYIAHEATHAALGYCVRRFGRFDLASDYHEETAAEMAGAIVNETLRACEKNGIEVQVNNR